MTHPEAPWQSQGPVKRPRSGQWPNSWKFPPFPQNSWNNPPTHSVQFSSVAQSYLTLCYPMDISTPGFPVHHQLPELAQTYVHWVGMPSNHLTLCRPLLLPSIFPSIRVLSNESVLHIMWPKYWSFIFSISPSKEYAGLISFRIDWFDFLAVQGTLKSLLQTTVQKYQFFGAQLSL